MSVYLDRDCSGRAMLVRQPSQRQVSETWRVVILRESHPMRWAALKWFRGSR